MVSLEEAVIARLETHGSRFEVLVDPDLALDLKKGKREDLSDVLVIETIFKDSKKGDKASEEHIKEIFGTNDALEVAKEIIKKGDIQLTTEQRKKIHEDRKRQVITFIVKHGINPKTGTPHPPQRIEKAMEEARVHIDLFKPAEEQALKILKAIRPIIPI
ncbi:MAG: ribosome assembly factor SBDS, partial [Candidatus Hydrothermarchaeales archaeon]